MVPPDCRHLPIDDGRDLRLVVTEHHVRYVEVAVHDAGCPGSRTVPFQPFGHAGDIADVGTGGVALELGVGIELAEPTWHLTFEEAVGPRVPPREPPHGLVVDLTERRKRLDHAQTHPVTHLGRSGLTLGASSRGRCTRRSAPSGRRPHHREPTRPRSWRSVERAEQRSVPDRQAG